MTPDGKLRDRDVRVEAVIQLPEATTPSER